MDPGTPSPIHMQRYMCCHTSAPYHVSVPPEGQRSDNDDEEDVLLCENSGIIMYSIYLELVYI